MSPLSFSKIFQVADKSNKPHIKANVNGEIKQFAPEEISAMVLGKMKEIAEAYLGHEVTHAVVTVSNFIRFNFKIIYLRSPLTLTMLNVKLPKMLEPSLDLMLFVLLMNRQLRQ